jgi:hypothetical protein
MSADARLERACIVMHDAHEAAAAEAGWQTQLASRRPWSEVPAANKATMRAAVRALLTDLADHGETWRLTFIAGGRGGHLDIPGPLATAQTVATSLYELGLIVQYELHPLTASRLDGQ